VLEDCTAELNALASAGLGVAALVGDVSPVVVMPGTTLVMTASL